MTESCRQTAYGMCVAVAGTVLALGATAFGAKAGAWQDFEMRCLTPMEDFAVPVTGDLTEIEDSLGDGVHVSGFDTEFGLLSIERSSADAEALSCSIMQRDDVSLPEADGFVGDFTHWAGQVLEAGRYVGQGDPVDDNAAIVLRSSEWREPVLEVLLSKTTTGNAWKAIVRETDLEA